MHEMGGGGGLRSVLAEVAGASVDHRQRRLSVSLCPAGFVCWFFPCLAVYVACAYTNSESQRAGVVGDCGLLLDTLACTHSHTHTQRHTYAYARAQTHTHAHMKYLTHEQSTHIYIHKHANKHTHVIRNTHSQTHTQTHTDTHRHTDTHTHTHTHTHGHTHTDTYTHTHPPTGTAVVVVVIVVIENMTKIDVRHTEPEFEDFIDSGHFRPARVQKDAL